MVLIPNDIGIRMRLQTEAQLLQPTAPIAEIAADFPELVSGQRFKAHIQEILPQGTYKAIVAGKDLTLSLPAGTKTGDTLELVVIDRSAKVIVAELATPPDAASANKPYPFTNLSRAAQLIGSLLPADGEISGPAPLNAGKPILSSPTLSVPLIAAALQQSVKNSGLFYEAHQAKWVIGRYPLAQLLDEPQAQHSDFNRLVGHFLQGEGNSSILPPSSGEPSQSQKVSASFSEPSQELSGTQHSVVPRYMGKNDNLSGNTENIPTALAETSTRDVRQKEAETSLGQSSLRQNTPDDIRPIVQQQLDALATDRITWQGELWPQQLFQWQIERDAEKSSINVDEAQWTTTLQLTTPHLGTINARLQLQDRGVRIVVGTESAKVADAMNDSLSFLQGALDAAGIPLIGFLVRDLTTPPIAAESLPKEGT